MNKKNIWNKIKERYNLYIQMQEQKTRLNGSLLISSVFTTHYHTLISSGDDCWPTFGFLAAKLSCLTLSPAQSVRFCDVSEGNVQNVQKRGKMVTLGTFSNPGPTRKLRDEVTSSPGRARLLLEEASSSPGRVELAWVSCCATSTPHFL